MTSKAAVLSGGFRNPVFQSQSVFRLLMDGMARPGTIKTIDSDVGQPAPLGPAAGAIALTLLDHETPVWLSSGLGKSAVGQWLGFHSGAPLTSEKAEARFAFIEAGVTPASFNLFSLGTQEYPDRSATIVIEVKGLGKGTAVDLTGPGIETTRTVQIAGLPEVFPWLWTDNRAVFPRGVDVVLTAGETFLCLPRTTRLALQ